MNIYGLMKLTLLDYPGHTACTVFLSGCNYRCPFCHNIELARGEVPPEMDDTAFLTFLGKRKGLLDGVCFTGGEPLLTPELPELMERVRAMGFAVKLDTDGGFPSRLENVLTRGLVDYVAMDVKNSPERYAQTVGLPKTDLAPVRESIRLIKELAPDYEFRTTVVAQLHDESSFAGIGEMIRGARRYVIQKFTDRDTVPFAGLSAPDDDKLRSYAAFMAPYAGEVLLRGI
ncbi:MAG: anaerobic ribonucleoside-triphosphate reductase activating protein [Lachnospiraceae bacterium]|nr:anaerobic ribonucleoside-triphosphate reductase activating protein [Lachnospiraceae bacterium]